MDSSTTGLPALQAALESALQAAAFDGDEGKVQQLIKDGANGDDVEALLAAISYGEEGASAVSARRYESVVRLLLDNGANAIAQSAGEVSPLQAAACAGYLPMVALLLESRPDINVQGGFYGNALQAAATKGQESVVQLLLNKGAMVNAQGGYYQHALQAAATKGHESVVQLLLDKGANVDKSTLQAAPCAPLGRLLLEAASSECIPPKYIPSDFLCPHCATWQAKKCMKRWPNGFVLCHKMYSSLEGNCACCLEMPSYKPQPSFVTALEAVRGAYNAYGTGRNPSPAVISTITEFQRTYEIKLARKQGGRI